MEVSGMQGRYMALAIALLILMYHSSRENERS